MMRLLFALVFLAVPASAQIRTNAAIPYGPYQLQQLDLYRPSSCPPVGCAVVVWLHGHGGSRVLAPGDYQRRLPARFGIAIVSCDYRTTNGEPDSVSLEDVKRCRRSVTRHAIAWTLDSSRVACWGVSLGAYLCNWLATTCGVPWAGSGTQDECVRGGVSLFGASQLATVDAELAAQGCPPVPRPAIADSARARRASPIEYVRPDSPPWFGLHSRDDCIVAFAQSVQLDSAYRAAGALSLLRLYDGIGHGGAAWSADSIVSPQLKFLQLVLR